MINKFILAIRGMFNSASNKVGNPADMGDVILQDYRSISHHLIFD